LKKIPSGSRIALEPYSPYILSDVYNLFPIARIIDRSNEWYKENNMDYIIFSQGMYKRYFNESKNNSDYVKQYRGFSRLFGLQKFLMMGTSKSESILHNFIFVLSRV